MKILKRKQTYLHNLNAKVGELIYCPICGDKFRKKVKHQKFCCSQCKDKYWNDKGDRHRDGYYDDYNFIHPERMFRYFN